jgi:DNA-binding LytR/AlgR family response regulator
MRKILIIEDDAEVMESIVDTIESAGFSAKMASNGFDGLKMARKIMPDLILCDIAMPEMDGHEVIKLFRSDKKIQHIPFIFLTAKTDLMDIRTGMQLGADDYITKPFRAFDLIKSITIRIDRIENLKKSKNKSTDEQTRFSYDQKIFLSDNQISRFIKISEIVIITADADYTNIFLKDGTKIYIRRLLKEWNNLLPDRNFIRIHRSTLVNLEYIEKVDKWFKRSLRIFPKDINQSYIVSERYAASLKKELGV